MLRNLDAISKVKFFRERWLNFLRRFALLGLLLFVVIFGVGCSGSQSQSEENIPSPGTDAGRIVFAYESMVFYFSSADRLSTSTLDKRSLGRNEDKFLDDIFPARHSVRRMVETWPKILKINVEDFFIDYNLQDSKFISVALEPWWKVVLNDFFSLRMKFRLRTLIREILSSTTIGSLINSDKGGIMTEQVLSENMALMKSFFESRGPFPLPGMNDTKIIMVANDLGREMNGLCHHRRVYRFLCMRRFRQALFVGH